MEFADTVASPMHCTQIYVQLQHTKTILFQGKKKKKSNYTILEPAHLGREEWMVSMIGQNWDILLTSH